MSTFSIISRVNYKMYVYRYEFNDQTIKHLPWHEYKYCIAIIGFSRHTIAVLLKLILNYEMQKKSGENVKNYYPIDFFSNNIGLETPDKLLMYECSVDNSKSLYVIAEFLLDDMIKTLEKLRYLPRISSCIYAEERYEGKHESFTEILNDTDNLLKNLQKYFNQTLKLFCPLEFKSYKDVSNLLKKTSIQPFYLKGYSILDKNSWDTHKISLKDVLNNIYKDESSKLKKSLQSRLLGYNVTREDIQSIDYLIEGKIQKINQSDKIKKKSHTIVKTIENCTHVICFAENSYDICEMLPIENRGHPYEFYLSYKNCICGTNIFKHKLIGLNMGACRLIDNLISNNSTCANLDKIVIYPPPINNDYLFKNHINFDILSKENFLNQSEKINKLLIFIGDEGVGKRSLIWSFLNYLDSRQCETIVPIDEFINKTKISYTNTNDTNIFLYTSGKGKKYALINIKFNPCYNYDMAVDDTFQYIKNISQHKIDYTTIFFVTVYSNEIDKRLLMLSQKLDFYEKVCIYSFYNGSKKQESSYSDFAAAAYINNAIFNLMKKAKDIKECWDKIVKKIRKIFSFLRENRRLNILLENYLKNTKVSLDGETQENLLLILSKQVNNFIEG